MHVSDAPQQARAVHGLQGTARFGTGSHSTVGSLRPSQRAAYRPFNPRALHRILFHASPHTSSVLVSLVPFSLCSVSLSLSLSLSLSYPSPCAFCARVPLILGSVTVGACASALPATAARASTSAAVRGMARALPSAAPARSASTTTTTARAKGAGLEDEVLSKEEEEVLSDEEEEEEEEEEGRGK